MRDPAGPASCHAPSIPRQPISLRYYGGGYYSNTYFTAERAILGELGAYTLADFTFGIENKSYSLELYASNVFDKRAALDRYAQCDALTCFTNQYQNISSPRTIGIRFGQHF